MAEVVKGCSAVAHLAALIAIPYSYQAADSYVATNVQGTLNLLEACRRHKVRRLVVTSTSEVYGTAQRTPMDETHRLNAQSPYAASKIAADQMALAYHRSHAHHRLRLHPTIAQ
jgi:dTDP-glucose 4,6-dehydratase